jgi:hypothetical protein
VLCFFLFIIDHINNLCLFGDTWLNVRMILLTYSCDHCDGVEESSSKAPSYLKNGLILTKEDNNF